MAFDYRKEYQRYSQYYLKNLKILYSHPLTQKSLSLILSLATIGFFSLVALRPTVLNIISLSQEIKLKKEVDNKLNNKIQQLQTAKIKLAEANKYLDSINNSLPVNSGFERFERELEWLVSKNNLVIQQLRFDKFDLYGSLNDSKTNADQKPAFKEESPALGFNISLAGSYRDLKNFVGQLEALDRITVIDSANFSNETEIQGAQLTLALKASVYFLSENILDYQDEKSE